MLTFSSPSRSTSLITQVQKVVDVIGSLKKHVERQHSERREATAASASASVKEEDNEEELNVEELPAGGDDLVQPNNDVTGDAGNLSPVMAASTATAIPTSEVTGGKKRSRDATASTRRSKKRVKGPHSTSEEAGTTAQPRLLRRSARRTTTEAHEGIFEVTSRGIGADFMPIHEEDGLPLDDGHDDHADEDVKQGIVAKCDQQSRSAIKSFDERFKDLLDFQQKFGHCNVQRKKSGEYQSLGNWCKTLRTSYKKIQKKETPLFKLTEEHIQQLEDAGFKWSLPPRSTFDEWYAELMRYKEKCGHCNVPKKGSVEYPSLGNWCNKVRTSYKKIKKRETPHTKLTEEHIRQLEDAGFKWSLPPRSTFDERYAELMKYKEKCGHCNIFVKKSGEYQSLGNWCNKVRTSYKKIKKRDTPQLKITDENIRQLEDAGFNWSLHQST